MNQLVTDNLFWLHMHTRSFTFRFPYCSTEFLDIDFARVLCSVLVTSRWLDYSSLHRSCYQTFQKVHLSRADTTLQCQVYWLKIQSMHGWKTSAWALTTTGCTPAHGGQPERWATHVLLMLGPRIFVYALMIYNQDRAVFYLYLYNENMYLKWNDGYRESLDDIIFCQLIFHVIK